MTAPNYSMTQPAGVGHQYTPPLQADVTPQDNPSIGVDDVASEYGQLCISAANTALGERAGENARLNH